MPIIRPDAHQVEDIPSHTKCGPRRERWISEAGGLTQFGAYVEELPPGSSSSVKHWHAAEDEMVYLLDGEVTLVEGEEATLMRPGDAATFRAGAPAGHCLENRSGATARYLVIGTRAQFDTVTYPDANRVLTVDRKNDLERWTDAAGHPAGSAYD